MAIEMCQHASGGSVSGTNLQRSQQACLPGEVDCWLGLEILRKNLRQSSSSSQVFIPMDVPSIETSGSDEGGTKVYLDQSGRS